MALAFDNRTQESIERLDGFCAIIAPVLERAAALEAKCALLAASLNQADRSSPDHRPTNSAPWMRPLPPAAKYQPAGSSLPNRMTMTRS
jgi:hypothetical protein